MLRARSLYRSHLAAPESVRKRRYGIAAASALFLLGFLTFLSALLIRGEVLTTGFYLKALDDTRAYDRVYEDLLADPEFSTAIEPFYGSIGINRSLAVSTLRFVAPPDQLRDWSEDALDRVTGYVRGDVPRYSGQIDLAELLENQQSALATYVTRQIIDSPVRPVDSSEEFAREVEIFAIELSQGRIPSSVPGGSLSPELTERITNAILSPLNPETADAIRQQVETYLSLDDMVGAFVAAAPALLEEEIELANRDVLEWIGGDTTIDPVASFADIVQDSGNRVVDELDELRSTTNTFSPRWLRWVSILVMSVAVVALLWLIGGSHRRLMAAGILFAAVGGMVWLAGETVGPTAIDLVAGQPLEPALSEGPEGWNLPGSARVLIDDIQTALFTDLSGSAAIAGLILFLVGSALVVAAVLFEHVPAAIRGRYDWVVSREFTPVISLLALGGVIVPLMILNAPERDDARLCNGHAELCERPYDEVSYPATHNSMANSSDGWLLPSSDVSLRQQLDDGVRALLIDTHYWQNADVVADQVRHNESFSPELVTLITDLLSGFGPAPSGTYLCHVTCWMGAVALVDALTDVREFLEENRNEVVTLIIEDAISAADTETAFLEAGLGPFLLTHRPGQPWPTLGEMITTGNRLVVMSQQGSPPPDWYLNAWDVMQETPFEARSQSDLSCAESRGSSDNSLFLMNHWINFTPPDRVDAAMVNDSDVIIARAMECEQQRGLRPNFVAVNFHRQGDVFKAVDALNLSNEDG